MFTPHRLGSLSRRSSMRGFTITEVALALVVFAMMAILYGAVFPMTVRGAQFSSNYSQGAMLAQHKMDQIRSAGFSRLFNDSSGTALSKLSGLSIIDSPQPNGYPAAVTAGNTYSFTTADGMVTTGTTKGFFSPGSTGLVTICDYATLHPSSGVPAGTLAYVTVTVSWTGGGVSNGSFSTSAIIAKG